MQRTPKAADAAPPAQAAFLRGIERRAAVFAQLQSGDLATADRALDAGMRGFRDTAVRAPIAEWPQQFWAALLATRALHDPSLAAGHWDSELEALATLGRGPRAALLLRLVAGLDEATAAGVLGVARPTYRLALQRALPRRPDGAPDTETWKRVSEATHAMVRGLSAERLAQLARLREAALSGHKLKPEAVARPLNQEMRDRSESSRWRRPALAGVVAMTILAFGGTFVFGPDRRIGGPGPGAAGIEVETLPPAEAPRSALDAEAALLTHPAFDMLLNEQPAAAEDPAFYAWLAAGADGSAMSRSLLATHSPSSLPSGQDPPDEQHDVDAASESDDAP